MDSDCDSIRVDLLIGLEKNFSHDKYLNFYHSLDDGDYMDTYHNYPEDGSTWMGSGKEEISGDILEWFPENGGIENIRFQFCNQILVIKDYSWDSVSAEYMNKHYSGLYFLEVGGYKFYLAAWINLLLKGCQDSLDLVTNHFLHALKNPNDKIPCSEQLIQEGFTRGQLMLVAKAFVYLRECGQDEYDANRAAVNLDCGWSKYLT